MRKNTARHWLHATLDLLPVILIPVFMIYSHRHDLSTDITIQQDVYKDFYQYVSFPNENTFFADDNTISFNNGEIRIDDLEANNSNENIRIKSDSVINLYDSFGYAIF